ncbi:MAG TPA: hypothetical protein VHS99_22745, partial [Chloroflexota bacterium]|nr:hypothetical protein [Chloroflexota bacterium]
MTLPQVVSIVLHLDERLRGAPAAPLHWAAGQLAGALTDHGLTVHSAGTVAEATGETCILLEAGAVPPAQTALAGAGISPPQVPEAMALAPATVAGRDVLLAWGSDVRGAVYATLELADRVRHAADATGARRILRQTRATVEQPANRVRSVMRVFASDTYDLGWYLDRDGEAERGLAPPPGTAPQPETPPWPETAGGTGSERRGFWAPYLTELVTQRFNRFQLALGIGYDFARRVRDSYFYFPYPFLLAVPGYDVRAGRLTDEERERNLKALRAIGAEVKRRGLHFQLGLWAQVYEFEDSPEVNYPIHGLTPETHAPYCRDALRLLLQSVPEIDGLTLRIHGESGIAEGSYDFWRTLFDGIASCGRRVELDLHAKGIEQPMIDLALATKQPLVISPKFWAEHLGLPYHQAEIRALERPAPPSGPHARLMALSIGTRRFTRYGYADLLREDRPYEVLFRIWPGTQRVLLWGDPVTGRAYGRAFSFGGAAGVELFEPLSFAGRRGSGQDEQRPEQGGRGRGGQAPAAGPVSGRYPYADPSLRPPGSHAAWEQYRYTYRLWGRLLYNPAADPEQWQRQLRADCGPATPAAESALAHASRILPLITTAHLPSAANNSYWPELYTNMPIVDDGAAPPEGATGSTASTHPYRDTPQPRRFGTVSPLDPALFCTVDELVEGLLSHHSDGRYTPLEVAHWLDDLAGHA